MSKTIPKESTPQGFLEMIGAKPKKMPMPGEQNSLIDQQMMRERRRKAEATSEVEKKRAMMMRPGGRSHLIKTSPVGFTNSKSQNLGGM